MSESVQRPHDKLFRTVFSDPDEAESFLRAYLPSSVTERLAWETLALVETSFVDESMAESESDLLYTVRVKESGQPVHLYILFEHQSKPDRWMRFRLLKYMCRIWDESFKAEQVQQELIPILPLVFYQGKARWNYSIEFADLFPESERDHDFLPRFTHHLIDQSGASPDQIQGAQKARIAQLLLMAAFQKFVQKALAQAAQLIAQVERTGGIDYVKVFVIYLAATQERQTVQSFAEAINRYTENRGGEMLTYAEELLQEGEIKGKQEGLQEGEIKGKIEMIESLLSVGGDWGLITRATGIDPIRFQALKEQLAQLAAA
ncbi:MAG: Rpn family recombination-promoting nuclease/putative transposase [Caldilineaceae bacterium]|nr:Rpn family recombination-promoting nuclease/putative transposase [Caldilineaceae bacterium]MBP8107989.1 Rpn family recombination-promoting nuclease/putative transposase [Caldilineaceae bacterium]MBP8125130.1 Rpn family recombination-promoting nuclease/putative transposase [Caldilineaceae bacterium]MBP9074291.1 Rpn family recombination-promoting nuclease/putative transposase [Caldilineaceae bacterium]